MEIKREIFKEQRIMWPPSIFFHICLLHTFTRKQTPPRTHPRYKDRRLVRSAAVQGLSRFASDIIIRGFDTPAKVLAEERVAKRGGGGARDWQRVW
jgi:hypothetical protein